MARSGRMGDVPVRRVDRLCFLEILEDAAVFLSRPSYRHDDLSFFPWWGQLVLVVHGKGSRAWESLACQGRSSSQAVSKVSFREEPSSIQLPAGDSHLALFPGRHTGHLPLIDFPAQ